MERKHFPTVPLYPLSISLNIFPQFQRACSATPTNYQKLFFSSESRLLKIQADAFSECSALREISFPDSVQEIGNGSFYKCKNLSEVHFPENLKVISNQAFYSCGLTSLELPDSLEILDESAFFKCNNLITVTLPPNVRYIGKWVFHGCNRLQYLEIRHDPEYIGEWIINRAATIRCYKGSKADRYCQESGFKVEYL